MAEPTLADPGTIFAGRIRHRAYLGEYLGWGLLSLVAIGLPFLAWRWLKTRSERWVIDGKRIERTVGVLARRTDSLELWRIRDLAHLQTFADRLFGDGRIVVHSDDATDPVLVIAGLPAHREVYERLRAAVESSRRANRVLNVD
jgi:hypothetical protein